MWRRYGEIMNVTRSIYSTCGRRLQGIGSPRRIAQFLAAVVASAAALLGSPSPFAFAEPCPDVDVVLAGALNAGGTRPRHLRATRCRRCGTGVCRLGARASR
jgi:hypothetical protein